MIVIKKGKAPKILTTKGVQTSEQHKKDFDTGKRKFDIDSSIYGHKEVKTALKKAQNNKCCFCEAHVTGVAHGDVEHFRPKGAWQQSDADKLSEVGYYWLAYDWDNLLFSCQICNQTYKKNYFPLETPAKRALNHYDTIEDEKAMLLNPTLDDPIEHLIFKKEFVEATTIRGKETIKRTGIDRSNLDELRRDLMIVVKGQLQLLALLDAGQLKNPSVQEVITNLSEIVNPKKPFFAMLRDNFKDDLAKFGVL